MARMVAALVLWSGLALAQGTASELLEHKTVEALERLDAGMEGVLGVAAVDLESGRGFSYNGDTVFAQASVIKVAVLARLFQASRAGQLRFSGRVKLAPSEAVGGSGRIQHDLKKGPVSLSMRELATAMIVDSDNTATNRCIEAAGMERINRMLAEAGFHETRLRRKMMDAAAAARGEENVSTPNEMARLFESIYRGRIVDRESAREMFGILRRVKGAFREALPPETDIASKTGELPGVRAESGIVFLSGRPFALSIMSAYIDDRRSPVPEAARIVYRLFEKLGAANAYGNRLK
jgi:beta-lactamase class A